LAKRMCVLCSAFGFLMLGVTVCSAQEAPAPGGAPAPSREPSSGRTPASAPPLSGGQVLTPGSAGESQSYVLPSLQWTGFANSNPQITATGASSALQNTLVGNLTLQRVKRNSKLNLDYAGGGLLYSGGGNETAGIPGPSNGTFHSLGITQSVQGRRWGMTLSDQFSFLPESPYGFSGYGGLGSFGQGLGGGYLAEAPLLNPSVEPGQSILTRRARRLGNVFMGEVDYIAGPRSTITATGLYGNLHFLDPGFLDSRYWRFMSGYNYALTRRDTLAISYSHSEFNFDIADRDISNDDFMFSYGRKLRGRLAVQLSAGPLISQISEGPGNSETRYFVTTYNSLKYSLEKGRVEASVGRFATGGSGVITGAQTTVASFSVGHELSPKLFGSFHVSYAFNEPLQREGITGPRPDYKNLQAGADISRELGPRMSIYFLYFLQRQDSTVPLCFDASCGNIILRHVVGAGFNWHGRPIRLD
jgi:hypothetical protein